MRLDECYRLLELDASASDEEIRRAHLDLTKVWHPDRFAHDPFLQQKAQEKLKAINEAYETIRESRGGRRESVPPVRVDRSRERNRRLISYAIACAVIAMLILLRRPTPSGLVIAAVLFVVAFVLIAKMS